MKKIMKLMNSKDLSKWDVFTCDIKTDNFDWIYRNMLCINSTTYMDLETLDIIFEEIPECEVFVYKNFDEEDLPYEVKAHLI